MTVENGEIRYRRHSGRLERRDPTHGRLLSLSLYSPLETHSHAFHRRERRPSSSRRFSQALFHPASPHSPNHREPNASLRPSPHSPHSQLPFAPSSPSFSPQHRSRPHPNAFSPRPFFFFFQSRAHASINQARLYLLALHRAARAAPRRRAPQCDVLRESPRRGEDSMAGARRSARPRFGCDFGDRKGERHSLRGSVLRSWLGWSDGAQYGAE